GLPRPANLRVAREIEEAVRSGGAVPATIAVVDGEPHVGLDDAALRCIADGETVVKVGVRDVAMLSARRADGATTVASARTSRPRPASWCWPPAGWVACTGERA